MNSIRSKILLAVAVVGALAFTTTQAQQVPLPKTAAEVPGPASGTAMTKEYIQMVGRVAYLWGWPLVNSLNRRAGFAKAPIPGLNGGVLPMAPVGLNAMLTDYMKPEQTFVTCPNQDVVYGAGYFALDKDWSSFKCRILATVSGSMRSMMRARTNSPKLASPTARSPAST